MADKCGVCGHETSVLDHGTGKYAEKMVCGLCEDRNFREQLLRVEIGELKSQLKSFTIAVFRLDKTSGYHYGNVKGSEILYGEVPEGVGGRWRTPKELAQSLALKHGFEQELWESAKSDN